VTLCGNVANRRESGPSLATPVGPVSALFSRSASSPGTSLQGGEQTYKGCRGRPGVPPEAGVPKRGGVQSCAWLALRNRDGGLERTIRLCYFFTSGQVDCDSGWNASSVGIVARSR